MDQDTKLFIDLPPDILLQILAECDALDILNLSSACKRLQQIMDEHQVWLDQARRLQIPIPPGTTPSKAELKDWVISRARVDVCWTKRRPGDLVLHSFETDTSFLNAYFIPGGEFVVLIRLSGDITLNRIERSDVTGEPGLREVARYEEPSADNYPNSWSRLFTELSYGCPVLVWTGGFDWEEPTVFFIDPVSQVIEEKQRIYRYLDGPGLTWLSEILAVGDRIFFINVDDRGTWVTVVVGLGPNSVIRRFHLDLPVNHGARYFVVSENGLVVTNRLGIHLYYIPEPRAVDDDSDVIPIWSWLGDASTYRGTLYKTVSLYPGLWLQGEAIGHTLEFDMDESGCSPVVVNHHITEGRPAFWAGFCPKMQGRKGMGIEVRQRDEIVVNTGMLGKPGITRQLRASLPNLYRGGWHKQDHLRYADLDEVTGRITIVIGRILGERQDTIPYSRRLYLADLPN